MSTQTAGRHGAEASQEETIAALLALHESAVSGNGLRVVVRDARAYVSERGPVNARRASEWVRAQIRLGTPRSAEARASVEQVMQRALRNDDAAFRSYADQGAALRAAARLLASAGRR